MIPDDLARPGHMRQIHVPAQWSNGQHSSISATVLATQQLKLMLRTAFDPVLTCMELGQGQRNRKKCRQQLSPGRGAKWGRDMKC